MSIENMHITTLPWKVAGSNHASS